MSSQSGVGTLDITAGMIWPSRVAKWLLPIGWGLTAIGFLAPWISHSTAALTLGGADLAEFVKFLPGTLDGSLRLVRQSFYMPPSAAILSIALLIGSHRLQYVGPLRAVTLLLAILLSLQVLPPAWSPSILLAPEFRVQTVALVASWLLLASYRLLSRLPLWLAGSLSSVVALVALLFPLWQFLLAKPPIDEVYAASQNAGWGLIACLTGLFVIAAAGGFLILSRRSRAQTGRGY